MSEEKNLEQNQTKNSIEEDINKELEEYKKNVGDTVEIKEEENDEEKPTEDQKPDEELDQKPEEKPDEKPDEKPEEKPNEKIEKNKDIQRPIKHIPISKYKEEKNKWREDKAKLQEAEKKIEELKKITDKNESKEKEDEKLKKLAEKWNTPVDFVKDLRNTLGEGGKKKENEAVKEAVKEDKKNEIDEEKIIEQFNKEFDSFTPSLKDEYPNVSEEQIKDAKKLLDMHAHSERFVNYTLEDIVKLNKEEFEKILGDVKDNTGLSNGHNSNFKEEIKSSDFKKDSNGIYDFSSIHEITDKKEKEKVVDQLAKDNLEIWEAYMNDLISREDPKFV